MSTRSTPPAWRWRSVLAVLLALVLSACSGPPANNLSLTPTVAPATPVVQPLPQSPVASVLPGSPSSSDAQAAAVNAALQDAAVQLGLASGSSQLAVQRVEARQWPDSALGCPRQGEMYSQVVTPGFLIVVNGAGKQLEYHADSRGRVVLCSTA